MRNYELIHILSYNFSIRPDQLIDWGKAFVTAIYDLEGDGSLAFSCYERVQAVVASIEVANIPNVDAIARSISSHVQSQQQLIAYANTCMQPGLDYFLNQLQSSLKDSFEAFKAARLFCPYKVNMLKPKATDVNCLNSFQFLRNNVPKLKEELAMYLAKLMVFLMRLMFYNGRKEINKNYLLGLQQQRRSWWFSKHQGQLNKFSQQYFR